MSSPATTAVRIIVYTVFLSYADEYYFRSESKYRPELETLQYVVSEHTDNGTLIADIMKDARLRQLVAPEAVNRLYFRFLSTPPAGAPMSIDAKSGMMRTAGEIDREAVKQCRRVDPCRLPVDVAIGPAPYFRVVRVSVEIADINDNAPYFQQSAAIIRVRESASAGSSYALPVAVDADGPLYGVKRYDMTSSTGKLALVVESRRADSRLVPRLVVLGRLDRESEPEYHLRLTAYDGGVPPETATVDVIVEVIDSNDHSPLFDSERYEVELPEDTPVGSAIVRVQVHNSTSQLSHTLE